MSTSLRSLAACGTLLYGIHLGVGAVAADETPRAQSAAPMEETLLLVASPGLVPPFASSVILVGTLGGNRHLGVILNHPIGVTLDQLITGGGETTRPRHAPRHSVNLGGPALMDSLFAVIRSDSLPHVTDIPLSKDLYLITEATAVNALIARDAPETRYFVGLVTWDEGELAAEMRQGMWTIASIDSRELLAARPDAIWDQLRELAPGTPRGARFTPGSI